MKKTIIIGCEGQDGLLLYDSLLMKDYQIIGLDNDFIKSNYVNEKHKIDILNELEVKNFIKKHKPDEIYYLAAYHHSSEDCIIDDFVLHRKSFDIHVNGLVNFLEAIRLFSAKTKLLYASSSLIFGKVLTEVQTEETQYNPVCIYGISKLCGLLYCRYYRNKYGLFVSSGILYNHESHLRKDSFLSKKIINAAINIHNKKQTKLVLGDLDAKIDWGYAPDFIDAMQRILLLDDADDFIVATGIKHSVRDFVHYAFSYFDLKWQDYVELDREILTRKRDILIGDATKLKEKTNWYPSVSFQEMIGCIIEKTKVTDA